MLKGILLPYGLVDTSNPIFQHEWRRLRWLNTEARVERYNRVVILGLPLVIIIWWIIERLNLNFGIVPPDFASRLLNLVIIMGLALMLLSSLYSVPAVIGKLNTQRASNVWDTLQLTPQYNSIILMAHDAIAQLRLWPFIAAEIGLRIAIVALFTLNNFYNLYHSYAQPSEFISQTFLSPICLGVWVIIAFIAVAFAIEPLVRTRLIIAVHLVIAFRIRNLPLAFLTGLLLLSVIHFSQVITVICLWAMSESLSKGDMGYVAIAICFIPITFVASILLWAFYRWLRKAALNLAYNAAFQQD